MFLINYCFSTCLSAFLLHKVLIFCNIIVVAAVFFHFIALSFDLLLYYCGCSCVLSFYCIKFESFVIFLCLQERKISISWF